MSHAFPQDDEFMRKLVERFPELQPYIDDESNNDDDFGLLDYSAIADIARHVVEDWRRGRRERAIEVLAYIEAAAASSPRSTVHDLIGAGFMEALPYAREIDRGFPQALGPYLRRCWDLDNP